MNGSSHGLLMAPSMEEFVKWVFAEDQAISGGVKGKFTLKISGCSRPELDGIYVKQPECYYRRPIFHCIENEKYLFYHGSRPSVSKGCIFSFSNVQTCFLRRLKASFCLASTVLSSFFLAWMISALRMGMGEQKCSSDMSRCNLAWLVQCGHKSVMNRRL